VETPFFFFFFFFCFTCGFCVTRCLCFSLRLGLPFTDHCLRLFLARKPDRNFCLPSVFFVLSKHGLMKLSNRGEMTPKSVNLLLHHLSRPSFRQMICCWPSPALWCGTRLPCYFFFFVVFR
jgi:hypothetical protein